MSNVTEDRVTAEALWNLCKQVEDLCVHTVPTRNDGQAQEDTEQEEKEENVNINSFNCFVCNGYYGPCFDDPTCAACHAFLFPNAGHESRDGRCLTVVPDVSDDSDSGNDEPVDNVYRHENADHRFRFIPIKADSLTAQLNRLSEPNHENNFAIKDVPPEILLHIFGFLDELSLWSASCVCRRWQEVVHMHAPPETWTTFMELRWPLFYVQPEQDCYNLYTAMMESASCFKCIKQMAAQENPISDNINEPPQESQWRKHRLRSELRWMRMDPLEGIEATPLDWLCCHWQATIAGPIGSPYEGGMFLLYIQIPYGYPMAPPVVRFLTRIFHPNISRHGDIGIDSIHHNWSLALTISKVLISIQSLLTDPFCDVCMEPEIGQLYLQDRAAFEKQARRWTWKYAMHDLLPH